MLFLIGYRGLSHDSFFGILADASVDVLLDVRRNPYSPNPDYQKANLARAAKDRNLAYAHGPALGVPGAGKSRIGPGEPTNFEEQLKSSDGVRALGKLENLLRGGVKVSLMCSEPNYLDCHRRVLVDEMAKRIEGLEIESLTARGEQRLF